MADTEARTAAKLDLGRTAIVALSADYEDRIDDLRAAEGKGQNILALCGALVAVCFAMLSADADLPIFDATGLTLVFAIVVALVGAGGLATSTFQPRAFPSRPNAGELLRLARELQSSGEPEELSNLLFDYAIQWPKQLEALQEVVRAKSTALVRAQRCLLFAVLLGVGLFVRTAITIAMGKVHGEMHETAMYGATDERQPSLCASSGLGNGRAALPNRRECEGPVGAAPERNVGGNRQEEGEEKQPPQQAGQARNEERQACGW